MLAQRVGALRGIALAVLVVHVEPAAQGDDYADDLLAVDFERSSDAEYLAGLETGEAVEMGGLY